MLVKKLSGEFSLKKFIIHDMRNLSHFSYFAIGLEAIKEDTNEIIEAIIAFKARYDTRIIIFAEKADISLLNGIIDETETYNIITADTIDKIKEEIRICVSSQGMDKSHIIKSINNSFDIEIDTMPQYSLIGKNIKIIVAGTMNRCK